MYNCFLKVFIIKFCGKQLKLKREVQYDGEILHGGQVVQEDLL